MLTLTLFLLQPHSHVGEWVAVAVGVVEQVVQDDLQQLLVGLQERELAGHLYAKALHPQGAVLCFLLYELEDVQCLLVLGQCQFTELIGLHTTVNDGLHVLDGAAGVFQVFFAVVLCAECQ